MYAKLFGLIATLPKVSVNTLYAVGSPASFVVWILFEALLAAMEFASTLPDSVLKSFTPSLKMGFR